MLPVNLCRCLIDSITAKIDKLSILGYVLEVNAQFIKLIEPLAVFDRSTTPGVRPFNFIRP